MNADYSQPRVQVSHWHFIEQQVRIIQTVTPTIHLDQFGFYKLVSMKARFDDMGMN